MEPGLGFHSPSVEEAICFGLIDSIIKKVDENKYMRKFTPRKNTKNWSDANKRRAIRLIKNGKMNEAGLSKIDINRKTGKINWEDEKIKGRDKKEFNIPDFTSFCMKCFNTMCHTDLL